MRTTRGVLDAIPADRLRVARAMPQLEKLIFNTKLRHLKIFLQSLFSVVVNYYQSVSIVLQDLTVTTSVLPVISVASIFNSSAEGIGLECTSEFVSFRARYQLVLVLPVVIIALMVCIFAFSFMLGFK